MVKTRQIEYTQVFVTQLHSRLNYLGRRLGSAVAARMLEEFIDNFEKRVTDYPQSTPLCEEASDLGMTNYHDYIDTKFSLRAIYRFDQEDEILSGLLFLSTRQSIHQALIQYCLHR